MEIVTIKRLGFRYPNEGENALTDVLLSVAAGEFLVICGRSGSGKTTLLRHLKPQLSPRGEMSGEILFAGKPISALDERSAAAKIGFVAQSPEGQLVTDKVWHELAFGLESLGVPTAEIRRRVAETASFFGIHNWFRKDVSELSGGQKQLLNLAAAMVTQPELLILDEPTSRLDPIAAAEFLAILKKINDELGTTVILSEHRLEAALPLASRVIVMENGSIVCADSAAAVGKLLKKSGSGMFRAMPAAVRIAGAIDPARECPVSVNEGRAFLREFIAEHGFVQPAQKNAASENAQKSAADVNVKDFAVELRGGWFGYERGLPDVLRGCDFQARFGEIVCVVGGNGAGKSTLLKILAGAKKPRRGTVTRRGRVCMLPQEPRLLFSKKTVGEEFCTSLSGADQTDGEKHAKISETAARCGVSGLLERHPYDLSGGETQRAALAKLLLAEPQILLLDEPTQGLDAEAKAELAELLRGLAAEGACVVAVSHDIEFCAELATRCALLFDGAIAAESSPREFFSGNSFYTTAAHRISRGYVDGAVTVEDITERFLCETPNAPNAEKSTPVPESSELCETPNTPKPDTYNNISETPLPLWRKICAAALVCLTAAAWAIWGRKLDFSALIGAAGVTTAGWRAFALFGSGICCLGAAALIVRGGKPLGKINNSERFRKNTLRSAVIAFVLIAAVAATVWLGVTVFPRRAYYLTATAILVECMAACFFGAFSQTERRGFTARRLAVIAVLCALGVAGRAAFFWIPQVKPVLAICILAGAGLGGEAGFTVGAVTMLVSNMMFGQGPWTPWQMFAAGVCGMLGGLFHQCGFLRKRAALASFGAALAVVVYGGIVNPSSAFIWGGEALSFNMVAAYWLSGLPMDALHAFATAAFLWALSEPILGALARSVPTDN